MIDYRELLKKYMRNVRQEAGHELLPSSQVGKELALKYCGLNAVDLDELKVIEKEIDSE